MTARTFVDTSILVYARDAAFPEKRLKALSLIEELWKNRSGRISAQVCNEFYVTVTRKLKPGLTEEAAWADVETLSAWEPLPLDLRTLRKVRAIQKDTKLAWRDALIVASAYFAECDRIASEDLGDGHEYAGIRVFNPFGE